MVNNLEQGFFGIGIQNGKTPENLGVLWRSAQNMGASFIFTIGNMEGSPFGWGELATSWECIPNGTYSRPYNERSVDTIAIQVIILQFHCVAARAGAVKLAQSRKRRRRRRRAGTVEPAQPSWRSRGSAVEPAQAHAQPQAQAQPSRRRRTRRRS